MEAEDIEVPFEQSIPTSAKVIEMIKAQAREQLTELEFKHTADGDFELQIQCIWTAGCPDGASDLTLDVPSFFSDHNDDSIQSPDSDWPVVVEDGLCKLAWNYTRLKGDALVTEGTDGWTNWERVEVEV